MADVVAMCAEQVAYVVATGGRWNGHLRVDLFEFKFWGVKQDLIPYVRQMVFAYSFV